MIFRDVMFFIVAIAAISGAIGVIAMRNPFYSVLMLIVHLVSLAALFMLLSAEFVAAAQVVVYAGAVMVLYLFVVAYVGGGAQHPSGAVLRVLGPLFALGLAIELCLAMLGSALAGIKGRGARYTLGFGTPGHIGKLFLTKYLFPFEIASILLLVAAVGAIVLARRRRGLEGGREGDEMQVRVPRPAWTGTMAESTGIRLGPSYQGEPEVLPEGAGSEGEGHEVARAGMQGRREVAGAGARGGSREGRGGAPGAPREGGW
jgi:NADH-quinone oxidoreductase subunit J